LSHDGYGMLGGLFVGAMWSAAIAKRNSLALIETGLAHIPPESEYARVVRSVLDFYHAHPDDWHACMRHLIEDFGYDRYPGEVHIIPNAGVVVMALAYGEGDFSGTIQIANM